MKATTKLNSASKDTKKTISKSETGHAKNLANFEQLISIVISYGTSYNPSRTALKISALQNLATSAQNTANTLKTVMPVYYNAVAARREAFKLLKPLITRTQNALKVTDTSDKTKENVRTIVRKIRGTRSKPKKSKEEKAALAAEGIKIKENSSAQLSYDNRLDNFDLFITHLAGIPQYTPNETELKIDNLIAVKNSLIEKNSDVITAETTLSNARIARNEIFYKKGTGLVDITVDVKTYIKSVYGHKSPQYKQVSSLKFTRPR